MEFKKALNYAFLLLRYRPRALNELRGRLKDKGFSSPVIRKTIGCLKELNYLNDWELVKSYLDTALAKGWGPLKVGYFLKKIGIEENLRKEAVKKIEGQSDSLIQNLAVNKILFIERNNPGLSRKKIKAKLVKFLAGRGFYYKDIYRYLNEGQGSFLSCPAPHSEAKPKDL